MSKALRDTKCFSRSLACAGQIEPAGAAPHHVGAARSLVDLAHGRAAAGRADLRELVGLGALGPLVGDDAHDLRDDVAGAAHDHRVADADVLARDLVLVVQRRVRHHHAADRHRLELGGRRQRAGAADLDLDVVEPRHRLLRRELVGDGPARRARHEAQPLLPVEPVDLVDDAVDVVAERGALRLHLAMEGEHLLGRLAHAHQRIERQAPLLEALVDAGLGIGRQRAGRPPAVGEEAQRPARGDGGIELAQRAGRRVPGIGEHLGPGRGLLGVELLEIVVAQIDLAAHLDQLGHAFAGEPPRGSRFIVMTLGVTFSPSVPSPARRRLHQAARSRR